jgi:putative RNA 2'-phosphotransferase
MKDLKQISKFLSLVLRHKPEEIGVKLDNQGWVSVDELIQKCARRKQFFVLDTLKVVVAGNDKQRFAFNADYTKIRASQGHSLNVDLQFAPVEPLEYLYHGTVDKFIADIKASGLLKMNRTHVHLSKDFDTAIKVGSRRGRPVILTVRAGQMYRDGYAFYLSANGVWLCDHVPAKYIEFKS